MLRKLTHLVDSRACEEFIRANLHKPYSYSSWRSMVHRWSGVLHMPQWSQRDNDAMFCSQLVAATLQHLGALDFSNVDKKPAMLLPADFSPESTASFPWVAPYNLGPLILIHV